MYKLPLLIFVFLFSLGFSVAQEKTEGAPITIEISSKYLAPMQEYTISGQTETGNKPLDVKIEILSGSLVLETENVRTKTDGKYKISRKAPAKKGLYRAKVTGADGKNSETASFAVVSPVGVSKALAEHFDKPVELALKGLEVAEIIINSLPPSSAREEFNKKYEKGVEELSELSKQSAGVKTAFVKLMEAAAEDPAVLAETDEYINELSDEIGQMEKEAKGFSDRVSRQSHEIASSCDNLNFVIEAMNFASLMLNFQKNIVGTLLNLGSSKVLGGAIDRALPNHENTAFAVNSAQGAVFSQVTSFNKLLLHLAGPGFMLDLAGFIGKKIYGEFCAEMKGPFTGTFQAQFYQGLNQWERYSMNMKGRLTLRYGKGGNSKTGFAVTGEFEGLYTNYDFWADITVVEPLPKNIYIIAEKIITPPPIDYSIIGDDMGLIARQIMPGSFCIKVKGTVKNDVLTLKVDKDALVNQTNLGLPNILILVAINPALPIPLVQVFKFPTAPARSVFVVGMGKEGEKFELKTKGGKTIAKKKTDNKMQISNDEIRLRTTLNISIETDEE